jgi:hypothetical protein
MKNIETSALNYTLGFISYFMLHTLGDNLLLTLIQTARQSLVCSKIADVETM